MGATDDRVRLALAHAAVREGKKVGHWEVAAPIAAEASGLEHGELLEKARSQDIARRTAETTAQFQALQVSQHRCFLLQNTIGDRAVFSGIARIEPLAAAIDALLSDETAYASWNEHFGDPPKT